MSVFEGIELTVHTDSHVRIGLPLIDSNGVSFAIKKSLTLHAAFPWAKLQLTFQPSLLWHVLVGTYDAYLVPSTVSYLHVWIAAMLARLLGRPICFWGHGRSRRPGALSATLRNLLMRLPHTHVFYTPCGRERWARAGLRGETLYVAPNALNTEESSLLRASISTGELEDFRRAIGLAGKRVVIFAGRLQPRKRPDLLIRAFAQLPPRVSDAHLLIIGGGPLAPGLEALVTNLGLADRVSFTGEVFDQRRMALYMMSSSVAAMPAAGGLFIQHAFDYGLPIVVGDDMIQHGPEAELVEHGRTGLICPHGDVEQLALTILNLLDNEQSRRFMGRNARQLIASLYNQQTMAAGLAAALRGALSVCTSKPSMTPKWLRRSVHAAETLISAVKR